MAVTDRRFNPSDNENVDRIKEAALAFENVIIECAPNKHRRKLALDQVEMASMFAVKANFVKGDGQ